MRWLPAVVLLLQASTLSPASVLHWTSRMMEMECDNHPVRSAERRALQRRPAEADIDTAQEFTAERPFSAGATLRLGLCAGELHILPSSNPATMQVTVHVTSPLPRDLTPKSYLQELSTDSRNATVAWKLPESAHPVLYVFLPERTSITLQFGKGAVEIRGIAGNKLIHVGKGEVRLSMNETAGYSRLSVHVAMGSFDDRRPSGHKNHKTPMHEELTGDGPYTADVHIGWASSSCFRDSASLHPPLRSSHPSC